MLPRLPSDSSLNDPCQLPRHPAARRLRLLTQAALIAWLTMNAAACASAGDDDEDEIVEATTRSRLPVPAEFRNKLSLYAAHRKWEDANSLLNRTDPAQLARAASEQSDIRYFVIMGIGPVTPGIEPKPRPARTWTVPGTGDSFHGDEERKYNLAAYGFAEQYNRSLASEEGGVR